MALKEYQLLYLDNDIPINRSFYCNNGDVKSRGLEVHVLDNSQAKDCTGLTLRMIIKVPSGDIFEATVANGLVTVLNAATGIYQVLFPDNMGKGRLIAEIQLSNAVPEIIVSRKFSLASDGSLTSDGSISVLPQGGLLWNVLTNEAQRQADFEEVLNNTDVAVAEKFANLETQYATDLTGVKSQLAEKASKAEFNAVVANVTVDSEVILARGEDASLGTRVNRLDSSLSEVVPVIDRVAKEFLYTANLFDKDTVNTTGYHDASGAFITSATYKDSDFIPVIVYPQIYKATISVVVTEWDENFNFVAGGVTNEWTTGNASVKYVKLAVNTTAINTFMFSKTADYPLTYTPHAYMKYSLDETWDLSKWQSHDPSIIDSNTEKIDKIDATFNDDYFEPIALNLPDFSGYNEPFHPSVIYVPGRFQGFMFWMVQSPYPVVATPYRDRWEVPVVYKSNDGMNWTVVKNPLDDLTASEIANGDYMSDPHMVWRPDILTLEVHYRFTEASVAGKPTHYYKKTTTDGVNWSVRIETLPVMLENNVSHVQSPSIIWDNVNHYYRYWYVNTFGVFYNTLTDGGVWNGANQVPIVMNDGKETSYWHIDVYYNWNIDKYHFLGFDTGGWNPSKHKIVHYESVDGINFTFDRTMVTTQDGNPLYSGQLYRACVVVGEAGFIHFYFSSVGADNKTKIIYTKSLGYFKDIQLNKKINSNNVRTLSGMSLEEMYRILMELKALSSV